MEEKENVTEEVTQETQEQTPQVDESKFESAGNDSIIKVDLSEPVETIEPEENTKAVEEVVEEQFEVLQEITQEEVEESVEQVVEQVEEAVAEAEATGEPLPENIQKLVDFMDETGGDINDYARLNQDYSEMSNVNALEEYYKLTKPHLDSEERAFLMEENFSFDEEIDEEREVRKKKIALKEQVAEAKAYLDGQKSKYYEEIKAGSKLTGEQKKAVDFFNRYNKESEENEKIASNAKLNFNKKTNQVFNDKFKGFEYNVGEKKYRFNVKEADKVRDTQSDINNFVKKFLNEEGQMSDAKGYHKALYSAMNSDAVAKHFYEQGKTDALKDSVAKSKNVDMQPRQAHKEFDAGGMKFKVLGNDSSDFKFKIKNKK